MSGQVCKIIATGNRTQALARITLSYPALTVPAARSPMEFAIANAETLCEFGTGFYDGKPILNSDQMDAANAMMVACNTEVESRLAQHEPFQAAAAFTKFSMAAESLIAAVIAGGDTT